MILQSFKTVLVLRLEQFVKQKVSVQPAELVQVVSRVIITLLPLIFYFLDKYFSSGGGEEGEEEI